ncbi:MAG: hypothetical protein FWE45_03755 [Firmicutes bacterium]|nr:hypothetical protein [Bacillota bacterium]
MKGLRRAIRIFGDPSVAKFTATVIILGVIIRAFFIWLTTNSIIGFVDFPRWLPDGWHPALVFLVTYVPGLIIAFVIESLIFIISFKLIGKLQIPKLGWTISSIAFSSIYVLFCILILVNVEIHFTTLATITWICLGSFPIIYFAATFVSVAIKES